MGYITAYLLAVPFPVAITISLFILLICSLAFKGCLAFNLLLVLFWFSLGMSALSPKLCNQDQLEFLSQFDNKLVTVEGLVSGRTAIRGDGQRLMLRLEKIISEDVSYQASNLLMLEIYRGKGEWLYGDRIRAIAKLKIPRKLGLPGEFDYPRYLALRDVAAIARVNSAESIVLMRGSAVKTWQRPLEQMVQNCQQFIRHQLPDMAQRGVILALTTGNQHEIPRELDAAYARAGVSHILSVSGFHVGVVVVVWVFGLRWLLTRSHFMALRFDLRRLTLISALPLMLFYLFFTGAAPPTARSVLMLAAVVLAAWSEQEFDSLDSLLLAAFILLIINPTSLFIISFQLSFLALWGLLVLTPLISAPFECFCKARWQRGLLLFCSASTAAILATLAPVLATFKQVSFSGIISNLVVIPVLGYGATVLATLTIPVLLISEAMATPLLKLAGWLVSICNSFIMQMAKLPILHSYQAGPIDMLATVLFLALLSFVKDRRIQLSGSVALLLLLTVFHLWPTSDPDGKTRMYFLSVGQGDATLIQLSDGRNILVDGGGYHRESDNDFGARYLVPALHKLKVKKLDVMFLTHPHSDHLGGLPAVAEQFRVDQFWQGCGYGEDENYRRLMVALEGQQTKKLVLHTGDQPLSGQSVEVTVLAAPEQADGSNEDSIVLRLQVGDFSSLLMADAGFNIENMMLNNGLQPVDLLKVGHHGSRTSSGVEFLNQANPELAIISAGFGNSFGLPSQDTLDRLKQQGTEIHRTDLQGTILVTTDGNQYHLEELPLEPQMLTRARQFALTVLEKLQ